MIGAEAGRGSEVAAGGAAGEEEEEEDASSDQGEREKNKYPEVTATSADLSDWGHTNEMLQKKDLKKKV